MCISVSMSCFIYFIFFFFSSRRRHTRSDRDWSSDVCSSDLTVPVTCFWVAVMSASSASRSGVHQRPSRSEEHTSELQSRSDLVCRLLLEKKKKCHLSPSPARRLARLAEDDAPQLTAIIRAVD